MASKTRWSPMPRLRNWCSTICCRANEKASSSGWLPILETLLLTLWQDLLLALANFDVEADYAVLVAGADHGNIAGKIVFDLNNLLRCGRHVGAVGQGKVIGNLLLDGDLRAANGGSFRTQTL